MEEPPKSRDEPIINAYMRKQIAVNSIYSTALCLFFLKNPALQRVFGARGQVYMLTGFFALFMFSAIFTSFCARTPQVNLLDYLAANKPFLWIMGMVTVIQVIIIYHGGSVFRTVGIEPSHMMLIVLFAFTIIPVDMIQKSIFSRQAEYAGV